MKRFVFVVLIVIWGVGATHASPVRGSVWAAEEKKATPPPAAATSAEQEQKKAFLEQVKSNIAALSLQGVTAQILAMQAQKEQNNLQQMQAVFCDSYKLDIVKFRQGLYRFDEKEGKFIEQKPATT